MNIVQFALAACCLSYPQLGPTATKLVGKWRYDTKSMKVTFDPAVQKSIASASKETKQKYADAIKSMTNMVGGLRLEFRADHSFVISSLTMKNSKRGKWSLFGKTIRVVLDDRTTKMPQMTLSANGKTIQTVSNHAGLGKGVINLVKY